MKLRPRLLVVSVLAALPAAILLYELNESLRTRDMTLAVDRFIASQMTDDFRERCESNPNWFIAGPREDRPRPEVLAAPDADVTAPRPPTQELPFEYFAYDASFTALSSAGPRLPTDCTAGLAHRDAAHRGAVRHERGHRRPGGRADGLGPEHVRRPAVPHASGSASVG